MPYYDPEPSEEEREEERKEQDPSEVDQGLLARGLQPADWETGDQDLVEWKRSEQSGLSSEEQEEERLKNTTPDLRGLSEQEISRLKKPAPQSVFYIVVGMALLLLLIVGIVLLGVFR
jgi:hypothetical protein